MRAYISALLIVTATLFLHLWGLSGQYLAWFWFDILMHCIGGLGIGLFIIALCRSFMPRGFVNARRIILLVLLVGAGWELFEAAYELTGYPLGTASYHLDTLKDLVMDSIGGGLAYLFLKMK